MDPDAALEFIINALKEDDLGQAGMAMEDLEDWLRRGGFAPKNPEMVADFLQEIMNNWARLHRRA